MLTNVQGFSRVWSRGPQLIFVCLSRETVHESKCSLHRFFQKAQKAEDELLKTEFLGSEAYGKADYYFIFTCGLIASIRLGSTYGTSSLHLLDQKMLRTMWYVLHGSRWEQAQNTVMCTDAMMWFGFLPPWENCTSGILQNFQKVFLHWLLNK